MGSTPRRRGQRRVSFWLRRGAETEEGAPAKARNTCREADLKFGAERLFWSRYPGLEHAEFIGDFMHGWRAVKPWFTDPARIVKTAA